MNVLAEEPPGECTPLPCWWHEASAAVKRIGYHIEGRSEQPHDQALATRRIQWCAFFSPHDNEPEPGRFEMPEVHEHHRHGRQICDVARTLTMPPDE